MESVLDAIERLDPKTSRAVRFVIVFGSVARGEATWKSDVDLLVLLADGEERARLAVERALADPALPLRHGVSPIFAGVDEFLRARRALFDDVRESGVVVRGDVDQAGPDVMVWRSLRRYASTST
ncbi:MAG TPA: nucleotidyltransferase domain-containing protein [Candidatus Thermoplasmatota archaeon]|nr:nucleotidyltransferase domain-containing protein [Candidatus Thermoplasmatota archaeon]